MKILFIGDVFGRPGRRALAEWLPRYREENEIEFVIANAENSAQGKGVTRKTFDELLAAGVDAMTGGNHTFAQKDILKIFEEDPRILRPANLPPGTPGHGLGYYNTKKANSVAVLNLMGRAFMKSIDCPFRVGRKLAEEALGVTPILIVDIHAEATSEKVGMAVYLDGMATAVIGTHTHIPTADTRISARGTAAITDVGMTGPYDSIIGVRSDIVLQQLITNMPVRHEVAEGDVRICGLLIELDPKTGRARKAEAVRHPDFQISPNS
ncbi:TIGR00282 family metallophosphoesterase [Candidatus Sumerlaeota bacterium]|nr:TIGR00282 family metallophosphoesterase [Candidatus Sumerlaeota bacterium]MBI3737266.1 TIGR00282 family metallophosphoesterase [Candidatus Sumerlaeota bacterium]